VVEDTWKILGLLGIDERYLRLKWISASGGAVFAAETRFFTQLIKEMGRNPLAEQSQGLRAAR
jgi:F420-non-reducing hydrogenase iron-sulfur subunit